MEIATIVGLREDVGPTHAMFTNLADLAWSDVAFSRYSARNTSVRKLQLSDKTTYVDLPIHMHVHC